jgi:putative DNA primase/helicase
MSKYKVVTSTSLYPETIETRNNGFKVLDTHVNLQWLLEHFHASVRYNRMTRKREIIIPNHYVFADDVDNDSLARIEYLATVNMMPYKQIDRHLDVIAGENVYHPIVECSTTHVWDGISRLEDFIRTLETTNPEIDSILIRTWMRAALAAAFSEYGFTNHGVLVLQGDQGIGKTEWVKKLDPIGCGAVKTGALLDPKSKDSVIGLSRFWIVELGELDGTFNKTDIAHLKSYLTSDSDDIRVPWGRKETHIVRRTAYIATVNNTNFLVDDTGNRRWWTVEVKKINYQHDFDMKQVWAEVKSELDAGGLTYLPHDLQAKVNEKNKSHERIDPLEELLLTNYDWSTTQRRALTATDVLLELDFKKPSMGECVRMGKILAKLNNKKSRKSNGAMVHDVPHRLNIGFRY